MGDCSPSELDEKPKIKTTGSRTGKNGLHFSMVKPYLIFWSVGTHFLMGDPFDQVTNIFLVGSNCLPFSVSE
jgi:hypothetical protein